MVNDRWLSYRYSYATPESLNDHECGRRKTVAALVDKIDTTDPAFPAISSVIAQMVAAGIAMDESTVEIAIKLGRQQKSRDHGKTLAQPPVATPLRLWPEEGDLESIVYYARRGDIVKIGTTTAPQGRFNDLAPDEILAWEPGGLKEERARQRQFRHLRQGGEYFRIAPELVRHCKALRETHGDPDPRWRSLNNSKGGKVLPSMDEMPVPMSTELVTVPEAVEQLGVRPGTIRAWASRKVLLAAGKDERGRPLYFIEHLRRLMERSPAYRDTA